MKENFKIIVSVGIIVGAIGFVVWSYPRVMAMNTGSYVATATTTAPTRLQEVQSVIDKLTSDRKNDASFIAETNKQIEDLKASRDVQAKIDALMIVRTQLDVEIDSINPKTK